jgi:hypothetical protein
MALPGSVSVVQRTVQKGEHGLVNGVGVNVHCSAARDGALYLASSRSSRHSFAPRDTKPRQLVSSPAE